MPKYTVTMTRTQRCSVEVEVEAPNEDKAVDAAHDLVEKDNDRLASNLEWEDVDTEFEVDEVIEG